MGSSLETQQFEEGTENLDILSLPEVHINSAALCRIRDEQGRIVLLKNFGKAKKGETELSPVGGGIEADEKGMRHVQGLLGIKKDAFKKGNDLRFRMNGAHANDYVQWFLARQGRETNPLREVGEELVDETGILSKEDLKGLQCDFAGYETDVTQREKKDDSGPVTTVKILEIFDLALKPEVMEKIRKKSGPSSGIYFVDEEEIENRQTSDGVPISGSARKLFNPQPTIEEFRKADS